MQIIEIVTLGYMKNNQRSKRVEPSLESGEEWTTRHIIARYAIARSGVGEFAILGRPSW